MLYNYFFFLYGFSYSGNWDPEVEHMNLAHILSHEQAHFTTHRQSTKNRTDLWDIITNDHPTMTSDMVLVESSQFSTTTHGMTHTAPVIAYVSPDTQKFFLSREALIQLHVISKDFPRIGAVTETCPVEDTPPECQHLPRTLPPKRPGTDKKISNYT